MEERGLTNPSWSSWRMDAAQPLVRLGREDEARSLIADAVARARRFGAPWALGSALRAAGQLERGDPSLALLEESVGVLDPSPCRLELARSLVAHGAALRRARRRADAREPLRRGLDLAHRCGAEALEQEARQELESTGARPRSAAISGVESLTPSQLRVCRLAAAGRSNPDIAQALFVTRRTVESHLASAYRKLGIGSREELAAALSPDRDGQALGGRSVEPSDQDVTPGRGSAHRPKR
jgi:DNA-binding CsgD family transcriptional regulator